MQRVSASRNPALNLFGEGKHGFRAGDPATGTPATTPGFEFFNTLQEEICSAIEGFEISLDSNKRDQLFTVMKGAGRVVSNIAELKALKKTGSPKAFVNGYVDPGDGGGGSYRLRYDAAPVGWHNGGSRITADDGAGWELITLDRTSNKQFGARVDGAADDTAATQLAITANDAGTLRMRAGTTRLNSLDVRSVDLEGDGLATVLKAAPGALEVMQLGFVSTPSHWAYRRVSSLIIDGNNKAADGVSFADASSTEVSGRWVFERVVFRNAKNGVSKPAGNIGNVFRDSTFSNCDYGYYAIGQEAPLMHAGADEFSGGHFELCALAALYIDSPQGGTGGTRLRGTILEGNPGFGLFVKNYELSYTPLLLDGVWFESNATAAQVVINGVAYAPRDIRLENTAFAVLQNGNVPKTLELVNSHLKVKNSTLADGNQYFLDANSAISADDVNIDGGIHPVMVNSVARVNRPSGNFAQLHYAPVRRLNNGVAAEKLQVLPYDGAGPFVFTGSQTINGVSVADGRIFPSCCELTIPAGATLVQPAVAVSNGKWYVFSVDAKLISGATAGLTWGVSSGVTLVTNLQKLLVAQKWKTLASISKCTASGTVAFYMANATGAAVTLHISAWQIMQLDTEQEALDYYNGGTYYK